MTMDPHSAMAALEDGEFDDFLAKVNEVNNTIKGLKDGTVDVKDIDFKEDKMMKEMREKDEARAARKAAKEKEAAEKRAQAEERLEQKSSARRTRRSLRSSRSSITSARRVASAGSSSASTTSRAPSLTTTRVGTSSKRIRTKSYSTTRASRRRCRTRRPLTRWPRMSRNAPRHGRHPRTPAPRSASTATWLSRRSSTRRRSAYSRAIEHFKGDKTAVSNRAAANLKLRNWLSALDDCSRVIDVSKFLDEDHSHRPPPPPLLKAYVRRATANAELERFEEAAEDLATALEMAPEAEKNDIKRQQKMLREDVAAAKREQQLSAGTDATATAETRARVRELLETLRTTSEAEMTELTSLFEAVSMVEKAEMNGKGSKEGIAKMKAAAANAALKEGKGQQAASQALAELTEKASGSAAARICIRQAGGVKLLLTLMAAANPSAAATAPPTAAAAERTAAEAERSGNGSEPTSLSDEAKAARSVWAMRIGKLLCHACLERRSQLEMHACGGTTQVLRELRKVVDSFGLGVDGGGEEGGYKGAKAAVTKGQQKHDAVEAAALAALAPQLNLLSICAAHETVGGELRRLASGEGAIERLIALLDQHNKASSSSKASNASDGGGADSPASVVGPDLLISSAAVLASLASTNRKQSLLPHAKPLCAVLARHVTSASVPLAEQAATALACLSSHAKFRKIICDGRALPSLLQLLPTVPTGGAGEAVLLPNTLAALHNCTLDADAISMICTEETAKALVPRLIASGAGAGRGGGTTSVSLARRAAAVVAKCAVRLPNVVTMIVEGEALPALVPWCTRAGRTTRPKTRRGSWT